MKVSINPRLMAQVNNRVKVEHPCGTVNFASYERIIRGMKQGGEMPADWNIIEVVLEADGIAFIIGPRSPKG